MLATDDLPSKGAPWELVGGMDDDVFVTGGAGVDYDARRVLVAPDEPENLTRFVGADLRRAWSKDLMTSRGEPAAAVFLEAM